MLCNCADRSTWASGRSSGRRVISCANKERRTLKFGISSYFWFRDRKGELQGSSLSVAPFTRLDPILLIVDSTLRVRCGTLCKDGQPRIDGSRPGSSLKGPEKPIGLHSMLLWFKTFQDLLFVRRVEAWASCDLSCLVVHISLFVVWEGACQRRPECDDPRKLLGKSR